MRRSGKLRTLAVLISLGGFALANTADARQWRVGLWNMKDIYSNGRFNHCRMWGEYRSGITLYFAQKSDYTLWIGMSHPNWRLGQGGDYTLALFIDGRLIRRAKGEVATYDGSLLWLNLGHDRRTRHLLRRRFHLTLSDGNHDYGFRLTGTSAALNALERCVNNRLS